MVSEPRTEPCGKAAPGSPVTAIGFKQIISCKNLIRPAVVRGR